MSDAVIFAVIFVGFFVLRLIAATVVFFFILPEGDRCPNCDAVTLRVESKGWNFLMPRFRTSWCIRCGWHGFLRINAQADLASSSSHSGQLPVSSKKSSK